MIDLEELKKEDNWQKMIFEEQKVKHNVELKIFDFTQPDFDEKFDEYKEWLYNCFYNEDTRLSDKSWVSNFYANELIENYGMLQHQYPDFLKEFLSKFVKTRFFKKYYDEYKGSYPELPDYCLANWQVMTGNGHFVYGKQEIEFVFKDWVTFGEIPTYKHDELCAIRLNFAKKQAEVVRGLAVGYWASKVVKKGRPVPKYMQPIVDKVFADFEEWNKTHKII